MKEGKKKNVKKKSTHRRRNEGANGKNSGITSKHIILAFCNPRFSSLHLRLYTAVSRYLFLSRSYILCTYTHTVISIDCGEQKNRPQYTYIPHTLLVHNIIASQPFYYTVITMRTMQEAGCLKCGVRFFFCFVSFFFFFCFFLSTSIARRIWEEGGGNFKDNYLSLVGKKKKMYQLRPYTVRSVLRKQKTVNR